MTTGPGTPPGEEPVAASRRLLAPVALAALLLFAAVAGALAWRQYRDAERSALTAARGRAVVAAAVFNTYFSGELGTLGSIAKAQTVVDRDEAGMLAYFKRVQPPKGRLFTAGIAWADPQGVVRVSTRQAQPGAISNVADRSYFRAVMRTGAPYVSEGLTSRRTKQEVVAMAVPTRDASGRRSGVLIGSLLIRPTASDSSSIDLGYTGLVILDRRDHSVLAGFARPRSLDATTRFGKASSGVLSDATGLDGGSGHVVAFARAGVPQWTIILDRPRSEIFAAARRSLMLELALIAGVALLDLVLLGWLLMRARSDARLQRAQARHRRQRFEEQRQVATTLQRSLLAEVPQIDAIDLAARYQAGSTGLEVGGDWYDVLARPDGIVHVTVGDVAGHGVAAAALMGQLRNAFRAYAYDNTSPAAIMRRLLRHMTEGEMATAVCITIDPHAGELAYASAGHPPPLLRDDESGGITQLDAAQAPPLGFATPDQVIEARLALPRHATLVAYTDGVIERRDEPIDHGIERLESVLRAAAPGTPADILADRLIREVAEVTAADDDIALLVMRLDGLVAPVEQTLMAEPTALR